jgi:hypothetical protein
MLGPRPRLPSGVDDACDDAVPWKLGQTRNGSVMIPPTVYVEGTVAGLCAGSSLRSSESRIEALVLEFIICAEASNVIRRKRTERASFETRP